MTNFHSIDATQVTNVTLNVKDLNKLTDFYSNVLGFSIEKQTNQQTVFNIGNLGYTLTLNELNNGRQPEFREAGLFLSSSVLEYKMTKCTSKWTTFFILTYIPNYIQNDF